MKHCLNKFNNFISFCIGGILVFAMSACGGNENGKSSGTDSLGNNKKDSIPDKVLIDKKTEKDDMALFFDAINTSMDSIASMDENIKKTSDESAKSAKVQIEENLQVYKQILKRQHDRIVLLESKLKDENGNGNEKMLQTISLLKKQLEEKDLAIVELTEELEKRDFDIKTLKNHVDKLNTNVAELKETNKAQEEALNTQSDIINEGYYIIGTKDELQKAGVMSKGSLFKKSKLSMKDFDASAFHKIDIRKKKTFNIPGKKPKLLSQAPSNSYTITNNGDGTSTLTVTDAASFWSITNFLVIRY